MSLTEEKVDELREIIAGSEVAEIKRMNYRLSDAIREGASVTTEAHGWGDGVRACALHAAVIAATARNYM